MLVMDQKKMRPATVGGRPGSWAIASAGDQRIAFTGTTRARSIATGKYIVANSAPAGAGAIPHAGQIAAAADLRTIPTTNVATDATET